MLALLQPRAMGSSQPGPDQFGPFGYNFSDFFGLDEIQPPPESPAPSGLPLLSNDDSKTLHSFLDGISSNDLGPVPFEDGFGMGDQEGLQFSEDWLPPQFIGHRTGLNEQQLALALNSPINAMPFFGHAVQGLDQTPFPGMMPQAPPMNSMPPPPIPLPPQNHLLAAEKDVLAAAAVLQNAPMARMNDNSNGRDRQFELRDIQPNMNLPPSPLNHSPGVGFMEGSQMAGPSRAMLSPANNGSFNVYYEPSNRSLASSRPPPHMATPLSDVQWGSDANFESSTFAPQSQKETVEALGQNRLNCLRNTLELNASATNTRTPSPFLHKQMSPMYAQSRVELSASEFNPDSEAPPRKRRKSTYKDEIEQAVEADEEDQLNDEDGYEDMEPPKSAQVRKRKSKTQSARGAAAISLPDRRRKSSSNGVPKSPRQNLTEAQKRENHIKSEQKRRYLITAGFTDLRVLVPGLSEGGNSKSVMLTTAADWLQAMLTGNEELERMVEQSMR